VRPSEDQFGPTAAKHCANRGASDDATPKFPVRKTRTPATSETPYSTAARWAKFRSHKYAGQSTAEALSWLSRVNGMASPAPPCTIANDAGKRSPVLLIASNQTCRAIARMHGLNDINASFTEPEITHYKDPPMAFAKAGMPSAINPPQP
jgi:hypothetical protein